MKRLLLTVSFIIALIIFTALFRASQVTAQITDFGVAYGVLVNSDQAIQDGQIVSLKAGQYQLSEIPFDPDIYGVIDLSPDLLLDLTGDDASLPLVTNGQAYVLVTNQNGNIAVGDWITSSDQLGIGMRGESNQGPVLGQALETYASPDSGLVLVAININRGPGGDPASVLTTLNTLLLQLLGLSRDAALEKTFDIIRYIIAAIVIIVSIVFSYLTFGKVARSGVEAVGRNPLARTSILTGVIFNIIIAVVIILSGVGVAYLIITL